MPRIGKLKELPKKVIKITEENRYKAQLGDIFTFSIEKGKWMYGRVVCIEPVWGIGGDSLPGLVLIYIYKNISTDKYKIPDLKKENLLCKPFITNHIIWMWGYFETIKNEPINDTNTYNPICLKYANDNYYNERGEQLDKEYQGCGRAGSTNIFGFEYDVLTGLGLEVE